MVKIVNLDIVMIYFEKKKKVVDLFLCFIDKIVFKNLINFKWFL